MEPVYGLVKVKEKVDSTKIEVTQNVLMVEFGGAYRFAEGPMRKVDRPWLMEAIVGGRYTYMDIELDIRGFGKAKDDLDWTDPFVGLHGTVPLSERWTLDLRGDIGGFDVGSERMWQAMGSVTYQLSPKRDLIIGYRALHQRYVKGSGADRRKWDMTTYGPAIGLAFRF